MHMPSLRGYQTCIVGATGFVYYNCQGYGMQVSHMTPRRIGGGTVPQGRPSHLPGGTQADSQVPQLASVSLTMSTSPLSPAEAGALQLAAAEACCPKVHTLHHAFCA